MTSPRGKLRKRLATSRARLKRFTFLVDVSLGKGVTAALKAHKFNTDDHSRYFSPSADDIDWLTRAGKLQRSDRKKQFIVITKDKWIRRNLFERAAVMAAGLRQFYITSGNMTGEELQELVLSSMEGIAEIVETNEPPFIASIIRSKVELINFDSDTTP